MLLFQYVHRSTSHGIEAVYRTWHAPCHGGLRKRIFCPRQHDVPVWQTAWYPPLFRGAVNTNWIDRKTFWMEYNKIRRFNLIPCYVHFVSDTLMNFFRPHYGPGVDSASNRNEYQEYGIFPWGKSGRWVGLTILPPSCVNCLNIWETQPPGTLRACQDL
jgi:hypothetical protein